jgi:hypothetical protein
MLMVYSFTRILGYGGMMIIKINSVKLGDHVHCRLFMGETEGSLGLCGEPGFHIGEFQLFGAALFAGVESIGKASGMLVMNNPFNQEGE